MTRAAVIALSHGGGPLPVLGDPMHASIVSSLQTRVPEILKLGTPEQPRAIVLVTAHWLTQKPTISSAERHELLYDYYGFPPESYKLKYDAAGSPEVAGEVEKLLKEAGLKPECDKERGWDHGVFIPMLLINPSANIPIVQLSVLTSESPTAHFAIGRALSALRESNVAIIGSGFASFHNLRLMFSGAMNDPAFKTRNDAWSKAVGDAVLSEKIEEREEKVARWREWPGAYEMHPKGGAEHFLPLVVCAGAGGEGKGKAYKDRFGGLDMWSYYWE
ncbi:Extradiol aromatic ring-opening dioxygenase [Lepidopterella palustris CBS 459.81]|uniref:Extradiol aromatic ring-opening dioxygenase n=1 Tax=Lepidopterella palustris CBS 459.81 TaxID=1314670 RepID=A0A8E2E1D3_9PEZI|nr:Extradiol aromatic ring-opening dioxygenase [Lepidopterella palustris CBS 459.81]